MTITITITITIIKTKTKTKTITKTITIIIKKTIDMLKQNKKWPRAIASGSDQLLVHIVQRASGCFFTTAIILGAHLYSRAQISL